MGDGSVGNRAEANLMRIAAIAVLLCVVATVGCASVKPSPPSEQPPSRASQAAAKAAAPVASVVPSPSTIPSLATQSGPAPIEPAKTSPSPPTTPSQSGAKADAGAKTAAKSAAPKAPIAQPAKKDGVAPDVAKQASPALDLTSLEQRLKDTKAIGVLTKITLKNQIDDLLNQFREFYQGTLKTTLAELRRPFDLLVLKVLSLLQDSDPPLASAIAASREAIWGVLADKAKFATIT